MVLRYAAFGRKRAPLLRSVVISQASRGQRNYEAYIRSTNQLTNQPNSPPVEGRGRGRENAEEGGTGG